MKVLIVVPSYNEEENILEIYNQIKDSCDFDILVVNDGSTDNTERICMVNAIPHVSLPINLGFSGAIQTGFKYANENQYDIVAQIDADGQHNPIHLIEIVNRLIENKSEYIIGSRYLTNPIPNNLRGQGSLFIRIAIYLRCGKIVKDPTSGMRAFNKRIIRILASNLNYIAEPDTIVQLILSGVNVDEYPIEILDRVSGTSHFSNPINQLRYMVRMIISILFFQFRRRL